MKKLLDNMKKDSGVTIWYERPPKVIKCNVILMGKPPTHGTFSI